MKFIDDNHAYINSLLVVIIMIPLFLIIIYSVSLTFTLNNDSTSQLSADLLKSSTGDVESQLDIISKQSIHKLSKYSFENKHVESNSTKTLKSIIQTNLNNITQEYLKRGILINFTIINIYPSDDPFSFDVYYRLNSSFINDSSKNIFKKNMITVTMLDSNYPVYDVYPLFRADVSVSNNTYLYHNREYDNAVSGLIIKKCPYEDYTRHGHSNITMLDCLNNHYYHFSHDGLCVFCRLENRSTCPHNGLETFIIPSLMSNESTSSIDHVFFNDSTDGHYNGSLRVFNNTFIYLDNAHGDKYGLGQ